MNDALTQAATRKAQDMLTKIIGHILPLMVQLPGILLKVRVTNIFMPARIWPEDFYSTGDVVNAWMASPSHRENVLSRIIKMSVFDPGRTFDR